MGKGYWEYIEGEHETTPNLPEQNVTVANIKAYKDWNQGARKVMHWLSISVQDTMIGHIQDAKSPKEAWDISVQLFATNTKARKIQLKNELHTVEKKNMSISDYTLKFKSICESLASINVIVDDDDKVEVCLRGLGPQYKSFKTSIQTQKTFLILQIWCPCLSLKKRIWVRSLHHNQKEIMNSKHFTPTLVEVEVVVEVVAAKVLVDQQTKISNCMIQSSNKTQVEEDTLEAGGVQEVVDIKTNIMMKYVIIVVNLVICRLAVTRSKMTLKMASCSRIIRG